MRRKVWLLGSIFLLFTCINCKASVNTYTRTNDNLYLPKDVIVTDENYDSILKTPAVSSKEKIYDFADLFSEEEESSLYEKINDYIDYSNFDLAIITVDDIGDKSISDFAYNFYDYNDFLDDGVVFVIYKHPSDPEIFMGNSGKSDSKTFKIYSDYRINAILSYVYSDIEQGNYYSASVNYIKILKGFYEKENGDYKVDDDGNLVKRIPWIEIIVLSLSLTFIVVVFFIYGIKNSNKNNYKDYLDEVLDNNTLIVRKDIDEEITGNDGK